MPAIGGGFSKIVPAPLGCADDVRFRPFTAINAPVIEHGPEGALVRRNMELYGRHTQEIRYRPGVYGRADQRQAAHGNDNRGTGRPGGWRERLGYQVRSGGRVELSRFVSRRGLAGDGR